MKKGKTVIKLFLFHTPEEPYWNEDVCYEFELNEINLIEKSTNDLQEICAQAVQTIIDKDWLARLNLTSQESQLIVNSWNSDKLSLYGRFDLTWDLNNYPKMLEYNADTPTSLFEAAIIQFTWFEDCFREKEQFNSLHEKIIARFKQIAKKTKRFILRACKTNLMIYHKLNI